MYMYMKLYIYMCVSGPLDREQRSVPETNQTPGGGCVTSHWISVIFWAFQSRVPQPSPPSVEERDEYLPHPLQ